MTRLSKEEPLMLKLSSKNLKDVADCIKRTYNSLNFMDIQEGGQGLIVPTFMEIMRLYYIKNIQKSEVHIQTKEDRDFFEKYRWCFDQYCQISYNLLNKKAS